MDIPNGHRCTTASGVLSHGNFSLIYPAVMDDSDAEFVCGMIDMIKENIRDDMQSLRNARALAFSWAGVAASG